MAFIQNLDTIVPKGDADHVECQSLPDSRREDLISVITGCRTGLSSASAAKWPRDALLVFIHGNREAGLVYKVLM